MDDKKDIAILSGDVYVEELDSSVYEWPGYVSEDRDLVFKRAYKIAPPFRAMGISNMIFRVHNREFQDLSFLEGETLRELPDGVTICRHEDGTQFLFFYSSIPTFDSGDREWDSMIHKAVYTDSEGIHLISCRHGYGIPAIEVYVGLRKSIPAFTEYLKELGCEDRVGDISD